MRPRQHLAIRPSLLRRWGCAAGARREQRRGFLLWVTFGLCVLARREEVSREGLLTPKQRRAVCARDGSLKVKKVERSGGGLLEACGLFFVFISKMHLGSWCPLMEAVEKG